ncbi:Pentatricopeptide repeat [Dillenia turbinata]|uniref:Pentatricopeptide repeat n=1 Tax=Dillenia turbinata TaxID=194707 RepID=A0AAN8W0D2_9MAGN
MISFNHFLRSFRSAVKWARLKTFVSIDAVQKHQMLYVRVYHSFDEMIHGDLHLLNSLLASHIHNKDAAAAWDLFYNIHSARSDLCSYTFTPVLGACSTLPNPIRGQQVHSLMIKMGTNLVGVTQTALMDMYSKYGLMDDSVRVFEEIVFKDVVTWNSLLSNFLRHGLPKRALRVFETMRMEGVNISEFTLCSMLKVCASLKALHQGKQIHALVVMMDRNLIVLNTALIDFYSSLGCIGEAMKVFHDLCYRSDDVMCNSLVSGCIRNGKIKEALSIMSSVKPNIICLTSALSACADVAELRIGKQVHCVAIRLGFTVDTQLCNALLDMYAKCGDILTARLLFDRIHKRDVVSWTTMIDAYGSHGCGIEALRLFYSMGEEESGVMPNPISFLTVLSACGHAGLVDQGRECFKSVKEKYGLVPGPEHYACFIDILGRAGEIEEVWCLFHDIVKSGIKPTAAVWAALLNACRINLDVSGGKFAAKHLIELESDKTGNLVQLSNFYASIGRWDAVDKLRNMMSEKKMVKELGSSWVTAVLRQFGGGGYGGSENAVTDDAEYQQHQKLEKLYVSTRAGKHYQRDIIRGVEGFVVTGTKQVEIGIKLSEDSRKYGNENTCTSGSTLSKAALSYARAHSQVEKERENLLKTLGTQVAEPLRAMVTGTPLEDARHLAQRYDRVQQEAEAQAIEVSKRQARVRETPGNDDNLLRLEAAENKLRELRSSMLTLGKEAAAAMAAVEGQQQRLTLQRLIAMVEAECNYHRRVLQILDQLQGEMLLERGHIEAPGSTAVKKMPPTPSYDEASGAFLSQTFDSSTDVMGYFFGEVMHSYQAESEVELTLSVGDYVVVRKVLILNYPVLASQLLYLVARKVSKNGWAEGECKGKAGWFPLEYVERRDRVLASKVAEVF